MRRKEERGGLMLDRPRLQASGRHGAFEMVFYTVLVMLGGFGALACVVTAFRLPVFPAPLFLVGAGYAIMGVLQLQLPRGRAVVFAGGALVWGGGLLCLSADCAAGASRVLNQVLLLYSEKLHFALRQFAVEEAGPWETAYTCTLFLAMLMPPFFWALGWVLARQKNPLGAFSLTGAVLSLSMALSIVPEFWALCLLLLFWCLLLLCGTVLGQRHRLLDEHRRFVISGAAVRPMALALIPLVALSMLLIYRLFPEDAYERPRLANDLRTGIQHGFGLDALMQGGQGSSNDRIDLGAAGSRAYTGKTMLRVKYDWGDIPQGLQKDYLKSFVGSVYTGHSWEKLDGDSARALRDVAQPGQVQTLQPELARLLPVSEYDSPLAYTVEIENVAANPRCVYAPYGLAPLEDGELSQWGLAYTDDAFLQSTNIFSGSREYTFRALAVPAVPASYPGRLYLHWAENLLADQQQAYWDAFAADPTRVNALTAGDMPYAALWELLVGEEAEPRRLIQAPAWARRPLDQEGRDLVVLLENYPHLVLANYLQLPEESAGILADFRAEHGLDFPVRQEGEAYEYLYADYIDRVCALFQDGYSYALDPPVTPAEQDFAGFFLNESKTGYCVHFATAAVALCRSAGIPARYAEGYVVPSGQNGAWVDVPDRNAHAWLEVYYSGTGWVQVEVTPVSPEAPATYYNAQTPDDMETAEPGPGPDSSEAPADEETGPTPTPSAGPSISPTPSAGPAVSASPLPGAVEEAGGPPMRLFIFLLVLGLAVPLGLCVNRFSRRWGRRRAFSQEDRNAAALCLYAHLLKLHKEEARIYYGERKPPAHWEQLALKARFGRDMLGVDELQVLAADAAKLEETLQQELPVERRLYCQYIKGLF